VHFTPTCASWLNQVEIWFRIITQKAIRRGTFGSVKELVSQIEHFCQTYNAQAGPFIFSPMKCAARCQLASNYNPA